MRRWLALFAATAVVLFVSSPAGGQPAPAGDDWVVPGQLLVRFRPGAEIAATLPQGATYNPTLNVWRIEAGTPSAANDLESALAADPAVEFVQPQHRYTNTAEPTDPLYRSKQHVHLRVVNLQAAWDLGVPAEEVVVAVVDDGVDVGQPELAGRIWRNTEEVPGNGLDDDANGCIDDVTGCNFLADPPDGQVHDLGTHGTFVAGLIAAEWGGAGIAGIAQNALIMPVRPLDEDPFIGGTTEAVSASILYAARNGADIINLSLTKPPDGDICPREPLMEEALREAWEVHGVTIVSVTGNFRENCVGYPGSSDYAMAVAASGSAENSDLHAEFSQYGPEVDVAAPGERLVSTCPTPTLVTTDYCRGGPHGIGDGTSFAAPIVSAVAALVLGHEPDLTNAAVLQRLRGTARNVPDDAHLNWDGAGIIDAGAALGAGSAFSSLDARGHLLDELTASVVVGATGAPECRATIWGRPEFGVQSAGSTLGVGECAPYWPPSLSRPWSLVAEPGGEKGITINSWDVFSGGLSCSSPANNALIPPGETAAFPLDCDSTGRIANDSPVTAANVGTGLPRRIEQDVRYATSGADPGASCSDGFSRSVWYLLPALGQPGGMVADTFGSDYDTVLAVYERDGAGGLTEVACKDNVNTLDDHASRVVWNTDGSSDYLLMAAAAGSAPAHRLRLNLSAPDLPENDSRDSPVALTEATARSFRQPAHLATSQPDDPVLSCAPAYEASLWFSVTATDNGDITATTDGSSYDTVLGVFEHGPGGLVEVACNDQAGPNMNTSLARWTPEPGQEYLVMVGSWLLPGSLEGLSIPGVLKIGVSGR